MKSHLILSLVATAILCFPFAGARGATIAGLESYGDLTLVDSIDCATDTTHGFHEYPANGSYVTNILGSACRAMNHAANAASYFSFRVGKGKNLVPGDMYLLVAEYPDDAPRTATLMNRAMESRNGFHTGWSVGDTIGSVIIPQTHPESMDVPLSNEYRQIEQLMILNEKVYPHNDRGDSALMNSATEGFDVIFQLFMKSLALDSAGVAIRGIKLYHVDDEAAQAATIHYPSVGPKRYITWREEMSQETGYAMNADRYQNARIKTRLMKALGFNCFSRDMLEFGYNQMWDITCGGKYSGNSWFWSTEDYYTSELEIYGAAGVYMMPYYEYAGSRGPSGLGVNAYRKAVPLWDSINTATHFNKFVQGSNGASGANVDLTDSAANEDFRKILDCTMVRYKDQANFVGAWIRNRGSMPMSFSDNTLARFNADKGYTGGAAFSRDSILAAQKAFGTSGDANRDINALCNFCPEYKEYREWWYGKRADFFSDMQMFLATNGMPGAKILYSGVGDESGPTLREGTWYNEYYEGIGCIDTSWGAACGCTKPARTFGVMAGAYKDYGIHRDTWTFYPYEYNHAAPMGDPYNYTNRPNVAIAYPYNTCYSVGAPGMGDEYRNASGDVFFTRHYCLYERCNLDPNGNELNGYYTCEMDRAGRAIMLPELYAVAYQDPTIIGFLQGNHLARNFTRPVKEFNENFLSLPAVKGTVITGGGWGYGNPTVRKYVVDGVQYYAVVNLSGNPIGAGWKYVTDDDSVSTLYETVSGVAHAVGSGWMNWTMEPYQLLCFTTEPPGTVPLAAAIASSDVTASSATVSVTLTSLPADATATIALRYWVEGDEEHAVSATSQTLSALGSVTFPLAGLADGTVYQVEATVTDGVSTPVVRSTSFTTIAIAAPVLANPSATVQTNGVNATVSVSVTEVTTQPAIVSLVLGGQVLDSRSVTAPGAFSFDTTVVPYSTNTCILRAVAEGRTNEVSVTFVARVYGPWFTVKFTGEGTADTDGAFTQPAEGTAVIASTNGVFAYVLDGADSLIYAASHPSEAGASADVQGRVLVSSGSSLPNPAISVKAGLAFRSGMPYGYGAAGWQALAGAGPFAEGEWVTYRMVFDFTAQKVTFFIDETMLDPLLPIAGSANYLSGMSFVGTGVVGDFRGAYLRSTPPVEPIHVVKPIVSDSDGVGFSADGSAFSVTIGNAYKDTWYTLFASPDLTGTYHAVSNSVKAAQNGTLSLSLPVVGESQFAFVVASDEPYEQGNTPDRAE